MAYLAQTMGLPVPPQPRNLALRPAATPVQTTLLSQSVQVRNGRAKETLGWLPRFPTYRAGLDAALLVERAGISAR